MLIRLAVAFNEKGDVVGCDLTHGRAGTADYGDGPEKAFKSENVSLGGADLSAPTVKLLQSLGDTLIADNKAATKKAAALERVAAADRLKEAQRAATEAKRQADEAQKNVTAAGG